MRLYLIIVRLYRFGIIDLTLSKTYPAHKYNTRMYVYTTKFNVVYTLYLYLYLYLYCICICIRINTKLLVVHVFEFCINRKLVFNTKFNVFPFLLVVPCLNSFIFYCYDQ